MAVYFIQETGRANIKIGFTTKDPNERVRQLQTASSDRLVLLATQPGSMEDERELHRRFAASRTEQGEWFRPTPDLIAHIGRVIGGASARRDAEAPPARREAPPRFTPPYRFYLAGKISACDWRQAIVGAALRWEQPPLAGEPDDGPPARPDLPGSWGVRPRAVLAEHDYVGPYFVCPVKGGAALIGPDDSHGAEAQESDDEVFVESEDAGGGHCPCGGHPLLVGWECDNPGCTYREVVEEGANPRAPRVVSLCLGAIAEADVVFAWIDQRDCYGTITELGYAAALGRRIWIASPRRFRDMWFPFQLAELVLEGQGSARGALEAALARDAVRVAYPLAAVEPQFRNPPRPSCAAEF